MAVKEQIIPAEIEYVTEIRHDLHAHPELGYQEKRTSEVVQRELTNAGIQFKAGLAGGTGVFGWLPATTDPESAPTIALRADMDALPIEENTGRSYSSTNKGVMHACGHDGHTSIMIGAARRLAKTAERPNNLLFLFQPAEEGGAGGRKMCEDGALAGKVIGKPVDMIFGLHGYSMLKVGQMGTRTGAFMASADEFKIKVKGKGGHAAMPHLGIDPIVVASHIITALQTIASRGVSPLDSVVVTIGHLEAGAAHNVIPDSALLHGTLRALLPETRAYGEQRIKEIAAHIAEAFGAAAETEFVTGYPVTHNDARAAAHLREVLGSAFGEGLLAGEMEPVMGAEDFSFYGQHVPACFYWLGLLNEGQARYPNLHAADFDFNDAALPVGIGAMCELGLARLLPLTFAL